MSTEGISNTALMAYGLRVVNTAWTGNAIQVYNGTTTKDIGFVANSLDTASLLSFAGNGTVTVSKWYDQSGNGHDAVQATPSLQPAIVINGEVTNVLGYPAIQFTGTQILTANTALLSNANSTLVALVMPTGGNFETLVSTTLSSGNDASFAFGSGSQLALGNNGNGSIGTPLYAQQRVPTLLAWTANSVSSGQYTTATAYLGYDSNATVSLQMNGNPTGTTNIGNAPPYDAFTGFMREIAAWPEQLSTGSIFTVMGNMDIAAPVNVTGTLEETLLSTNSSAKITFAGMEVLMAPVVVNAMITGAYMEVLCEIPRSSAASVCISGG